MARHQWSTKPEGGASWSHLPVLSSGLGSAGGTPAGSSPALSWQRRLGTRAPEVRGSIPAATALSEGKANPAGTASSRLLLDVAEAPQQESLRKESAAPSPAIEAESENWICVCVLLKTQSPYMLRSPANKITFGSTYSWEHVGH